jgi:hypothetical protein
MDSHMSRIFIQSVVPVLVVLSLVGSVTASERPHIILMMADDLGWGDVGYHGSRLPRLTSINCRNAACG